MAIHKQKPLSMSPEEISAWEQKDKHKRKLHEVEFPSDVKEGGKTGFIIHKPTMQVIGAVADISKSKGTQAANDLLINSCTAAGDMEEIEADTDLQLGLLEEIGKLVDAKKKI